LGHGTAVKAAIQQTAPEAGVDWDLPRGSYDCRKGNEFYASGHPRPIPGVPKERNLRGISFAVANMTGFVVRACERLDARSYEAVCSELTAGLARSNGV